MNQHFDRLDSQYCDLRFDRSDQFFISGYTGGFMISSFSRTFTVHKKGRSFIFTEYHAVSSDMKVVVAKSTATSSLIWVDGEMRCTCLANRVDTWRFPHREREEPIGHSVPYDLETIVGLENREDYTVHDVCVTNLFFNHDVFSASLFPFKKSRMKPCNMSIRLCNGEIRMADIETDEIRILGSQGLSGVEFKNVKCKRLRIDAFASIIFEGESLDCDCTLVLHQSCTVRGLSIRRGTLSVETFFTGSIDVNIADCPITFLGEPCECKVKHITRD